MAVRLKWGTRANPLAGYYAWEDWKEGGKIGPRPYLVGGATLYVPQWAWKFYEERHPPTPPVVVKPLVARKGLYTAWGFDNGQFSDVVALTTKMKQHGYETLGIQTGTSESRRHTIIDECNRHGIALGIWDDIFTTNRTPQEAAQSVDHWQAKFYDANVEGYVRSGWAQDFRALKPNLPCSVFTDFRGLDTPELAKPWIDMDFDCVTECYLSQNPHAKPANMDYRAYQIGWMDSYPCLSNYNNVPLSTYQNIMTQKSGRPFTSFKVYLAEYQRPEDWSFSV